jgi:subtilisin family serine protease
MKFKIIAVALLVLFAAIAGSFWFAGTAANPKGTKNDPGSQGASPTPAPSLAAGSQTPGPGSQSAPGVARHVFPRAKGLSASPSQRDVPMADIGTADLFKNAKVLASHDDPPNAAGEFHRVSLLQTDMKYPLIRLEEQLVRQGHLGDENVISSQAAVADHLVVQLQPGSSEQDLQAVVAKNGGRILQQMAVPGLYLVQLPTPTLNSLPQAITKFSAETGTLQFAEADTVVHAMLAPNDPSFTQEWGLSNTGQNGGKAHADIDATDAWGITKGSANIVVAVIDTGIDYNHPDLAANIWTNPGGVAGDPYTGDLHGWNFYGNNNDPMDDFFHGTHVAGTIGAVGNNATGVAGVAWNVKLMALKFLSANGGGYTSDAISAINYAITMHVQVMSNSWGGGGYSQALKNAIDAAGQAGILFVVAAGNDANNNDTNPSYPASYTSSNLIAVAATDDTDQLAGFSNYGAKRPSSSSTTAKRTTTAP